jgi:hypothetical protein
VGVLLTLRPVPGDDGYKMQATPSSIHPLCQPWPHVCCCQARVRHGLASLFCSIVGRLACFVCFAAPDSLRPRGQARVRTGSWCAVSGRRALWMCCARCVACGCLTSTLIITPGCRGC